ncbi:class D beta-lactamase [Pseudomonas sp. LFM046]|uniref:class D beta-lactamase n=1 Tax=Pseudomonas sp. LFM046 TaxID=1608357 RepID=UPI0005CFE1DF|nr:class D beta-lactamase [Pseudomonas sp. LFM046]
MKWMLAGLLALASGWAAAAQWQESPEVAQLFQQQGLKGTFVLYDPQRETLVGHDRVRAERRYLPASTFKLANSLIGLSTGAVSSVDEVLPYGGKPQPIKAWEKNMGLREAIRISNVPIYQELARRIGLPRMAEAVRRLDYGNAEVGKVVDIFWLRGPLKISALEQARFVAGLAKGRLPFPADAQAKVREIALLEQGPDWALYGKTGWATREEPPIGWWVGWVEKQGEIQAFALNIDMTGEADLPKRVELGKAALRQLGVIR